MDIDAYIKNFAAIPVAFSSSVNSYYQNPENNAFCKEIVGRLGFLAVGITAAVWSAALVAITAVSAFFNALTLGYFKDLSSFTIANAMTAGVNLATIFTGITSMIRPQYMNEKHLEPESESTFFTVAKASLELSMKVRSYYEDTESDAVCKEIVGRLGFLASEIVTAVWSAVLVPIAAISLAFNTITFGLIEELDKFAFKVSFCAGTNLLVFMIDLPAIIRPHAGVEART